MKTGKTSAVTLGLVGGLALGAWIGSEMTLMHREVVLSEPAAVTTQAVEEPAAPATRATPKRLTRVATRSLWRRRRRAGAGIRTKAGDDDSCVGARTSPRDEAGPRARNEAAACGGRFQQRRAVRNARACRAQHAGAVRPVEASRPDGRAVARSGDSRIEARSRCAHGSGARPRGSAVGHRGARDSIVGDAVTRDQGSGIRDSGYRIGVQKGPGVLHLGAFPFSRLSIAQADRLHDAVEGRPVARELALRARP